MSRSRGVLYQAAGNGHHRWTAVNVGFFVAAPPSHDSRTYPTNQRTRSADANRSALPTVSDATVVTMSVPARRHIYRGTPNKRGGLVSAAIAAVNQPQKEFVIFAGAQRSLEFPEVRSQPADLRNHVGS